MKKWNATQLKYLMAAVMVLDHIPHITGIVSPLWEGIFHALTRCVGVWFAYMAMGLHPYSKFEKLPHPSLELGADHVCWK